MPKTFEELRRNCSSKLCEIPLPVDEIMAVLWPIIQACEAELDQKIAEEAGKYADALAQMAEGQVRIVAEAVLAESEWWAIRGNVLDVNGECCKRLLSNRAKVKGGPHAK